MPYFDKDYLNQQMLYQLMLLDCIKFSNKVVVLAYVHLWLTLNQLHFHFYQVKCIYPKNEFLYLVSLITFYLSSLCSIALNYILTYVPVYTSRSVLICPANFRASFSIAFQFLPLKVCHCGAAFKYQNVAV